MENDRKPLSANPYLEDAGWVRDDGLGTPIYWRDPETGRKFPTGTALDVQRERDIAGQHDLVVLAAAALQVRGVNPQTGAPYIAEAAADARELLAALRAPTAPETI